MTTPNDFPQHRLTDYLYKKAAQSRIPISGTFELSPVCNFACTMCYVRKTPQEVQAHSRSMLTLDDWRRIAAEAKEQGMLYLLLTGGEPFLWPHFWTLYEELIDAGMLISINSNGSLIDEAAIVRLKRRPPRRINITLYGASDETYQRLCGAKNVFTKVDKAICGLKEAGISVHLNCSLTPLNACDADAIVDYAAKQGLNLSLTPYMFPPIRRDPCMVGINERFTPEETAEYRLRCYRRQHGEEPYQQYLADIRNGCIEPPELEDCADPVDGKIRCRAGRAAFWITWDGWLTPCGLVPEPKVDLTRTDFAEGWRKLVNLADSTRLSGVCSTCPNQKICHPCVAMALAETGTSTGIPRFLCQMAQRMRQIAESQT